jgi:O-antigen/teichoic acid export membrane protein
MGHSFINGMVSSVAQPVLAQVANERERQLHVFRRMMRFTCFISFPAMLGLSLTAPELITITITDKWAESAKMLQMLCISGAFIPIINLCSNLLISKGKSNIYMWNTIALVMVQLSIVLALHPYGIYRMLMAYITINIAWLLVWHHFVREQIRYSFLNFVKDLFPYLSIAVVVMLITQVCTSYCTDIYVRFMAKIGMAASLYILIMWLSGSVTFKESINFILKKKTDCL